MPERVTKEWLDEQEKFREEQVEWHDEQEKRIRQIRFWVLVIGGVALALVLALAVGLVIYRSDAQERRDQDCRKDERLYLRQVVRLKETYRFLAKYHGERIGPDAARLLGSVFRQLPTIESEARKKRLTVIPICDEPGFGLPETKKYEPDLPDRKTFSGLKRRSARVVERAAARAAGQTASVSGESLPGSIAASPLAQELRAARPPPREGRAGPEPDRSSPPEGTAPSPLPSPSPPPPGPSQGPLPLVPRVQVCTMIVRVNCDK